MTRTPERPTRRVLPRLTSRWATRTPVFKAMALGILGAGLVASVLVGVAAKGPAATTAAGGPDAVVAASESSLQTIGFGQAWNRIAETDRPFVVTVLGDSTGDEPGEWVDVAMRQIATEQNRPLIVHPWDNQLVGYLPEVLHNAGAPGAPLIVWNGSARGKTPAYSLAHLAVMAPEKPDVVIVNHGLNNVRNPADVGPQLSALLGTINRQWPASVGYAAILENPRFDEWAAAHAQVIDTVTGWLRANPTVLAIDVHSAYEATGNAIGLLLPDHLHPSLEGSALTAATVLNAIKDPSEG
ncbi:SGNH/GDSL hydrolase family protein [Okibacterium fritillariae]|uniref:SGNH/GDSL hydrolase family protein n=1 Tax=Okibacterium fritillariae TaxID=123320 RepID=UPI0040555113